MLSFFPRDVLDEIWDLIGSVSEGFPTYLSIFNIERQIASLRGRSIISLISSSHSVDEVYTFQDLGIILR